MTRFRCDVRACVRRIAVWPIASTSDEIVHLSGDHEETFDAGVFGIRRPGEVVAPEAGAVEHVRDTVTAQQLHAVGVALTTDEHVVQQLDRTQL